ncbi:uncharacterized protein LOC102703980 [Oryza brachyantha]|uniref:DUF7895 domain-containing protein n=1 Tax=Oryza brachyantha TaxID=4533 RepID=J3MHW5_ORYBR|nr:uncharacterized protein LOC102703980 [Oryza brachyantha]
MAAAPCCPGTPARGPSPSSSCRILQATVVSSRTTHRRVAALPETAAACVAAAGLVGVAATFLVGRARPAAAPRREEEEEEECSDCGGTGLCPRCKGEGFVFKQLPEEAASRARKAAKNMATRYTAGLPTKWTYCNRCSSTRSCTTCGGSGAIIATTKTTN